MGPGPIPKKGCESPDVQQKKVNEIVFEGLWQKI